MRTFRLLSAVFQLVEYEDISIAFSCVSIGSLMTGRLVVDNLQGHFFS